MEDTIIDVTRLVGRFAKGKLPTGVDRVSLEYVKHFAGRSRAVLRFGAYTVLLSRPASEILFHGLLNRPAGFLKTLAWSAGQKLLCTERGKNLDGTFLINTGHSGLEVEDYSARFRKRGVKPIFMVHDLIPISYPEYCREGERKKHLVRMKNVLRLSSGVIANSRSTLHELEDFAADAGLPVPPSVVAPLSPPEFPAPSSARPLAGPYFVVLGTIEPRKNHLMLLQLWRRLVQRLGENAPRLVVIGQRGWECENILDLLDRCEILRGFLIEMSACPDADLATYLYHSQALLFPSFAEGYGLPLVEALSLGVPVIASDLPVFREIAGEIPEYVGPLDGMGWMSLIEAYADPRSPVRPGQLERMKKFTHPTWMEHFDAVDELLGRLSFVH